MIQFYNTRIWSHRGCRPTSLTAGKIGWVLSRVPWIEDRWSVNHVLEAVGLFLCAETLSPLQIVSPSNLSCYVPNQFAGRGAPVFLAQPCAPFPRQFCCEDPKGLRLKSAVGYVKKKRKRHFAFDLSVSAKVSAQGWSPVDNHIVWFVSEPSMFSGYDHSYISNTAKCAASIEGDRPRHRRWGYFIKPITDIQRRILRPVSILIHQLTTSHRRQHLIRCRANPASAKLPLFNPTYFSLKFY